jgi:hypothetical protein
MFRPVFVKETILNATQRQYFAGNLFSSKNTPKKLRLGTS